MLFSPIDYPALHTGTIYPHGFGENSNGSLPFSSPSSSDACMHRRAV